MRDEGWLLKAARDPLAWFEPGSPLTKADLAAQLIDWLDKRYLRARDRLHDEPGRLLSRVLRYRRKFAECVAEAPRAALVPGGEGIALRFLAGTCRYPGLDFDRERSDVALRLACKAARETDAPGASFMLMVGDQIYADYTGGAFDTQSAIEKYLDGYAAAYRSPGFRELARSLPHYMTIEDHEIDNDWSLDRIKRSPDPGDALRGVRCAIAAYDAFQSAHGPALELPWRFVTASTPADRVPFRGFATSFVAGGIPFFIMDTRTQRRQGEAPFQPRIANPRQLEALANWLRRQPPDAPKFVVSGSVFFPGIEEFARDDCAYRARGDTWQAYPEDQQTVLEAIARHQARHVVFVSGDYHCAAIAQGRLVRNGRTVVERVTGIVVPPFYAPLPFANAHPGTVIPRGSIGDAARAQLHYQAKAYEGWVGFADLRLRRGATGWQLEVRYRYEDKRVETEPPLLL
jgi:alkaline phosphatase D